MSPAALYRPAIDRCERQIACLDRAIDATFDESDRAIAGKDWRALDRIRLRRAILLRTLDAVRALRNRLEADARAAEDEHLAAQGFCG